MTRNHAFQVGYFSLCSLSRIYSTLNIKLTFTLINFQNTKNNHDDKDSYLQVAFAYHFIMEKVADNTPLRIEGKIFSPFK